MELVLPKNSLSVCGYMYWLLVWLGVIILLICVNFPLAFFSFFVSSLILFFTQPS
jgi:hypothetical protein